MREILFRGKRLDNGEWVEGFYCSMAETTYAFKEDYERNPVATHHYIAYSQMTDWGLPNKMYLREVDPTTVGQYTGLTDKNGKRVFEGDILLNTTFGDKWVTEYEDGAFVLKLIGDIERVFLGIVVGFAVIGNIHDKEET